MSLAEVPNYDDRRSPEFDRTPPQDLVAEQSVLGGMLLSKDAIGEVVEIIRHRDFYRPAHELIFDVIVDLYGRGEPADAVTVAAELTKRGEIARAGGAPYLHTLISAVPTAASVGPGKLPVRSPLAAPVGATPDTQLKVPVPLVERTWPAVPFVASPTLRKVFTGLAKAACPSRCGRSLCPPFGGFRWPTVSRRPPELSAPC